MIIALYLFAIVAANLSVAHFGPSSAPINALLFIGATLTLRDRLHDRYGPRAMLVLIPLGALLSAALGADVARIAAAGAAAFALSETVDAITYHALRRRRWLSRANGSNVASALVDSIAFPLLAFGMVPLWIIAAQFVAKTLGGAVWSLILRPRARSAPHYAAAAVTGAILILAQPAGAQIASVSAGVVRTPVSTDPAAELYLASAPVLGVRPYIIGSWTPLADHDPHRPVVITQLALPVVANARVLATLDAGATWFPFTGYRPTPTVGGRLGVFLPARLQAFSLLSLEPRNEWARTVVVGVSRTLYFRR